MCPLKNTISVLHAEQQAVSQGRLETQEDECKEWTLQRETGKNKQTGAMLHCIVESGDSGAYNKKKNPKKDLNSIIGISED